MTTDAELVEASRLQPERFDELVRRHHAAILRFAARRAGADAAADVAQETFTRAFVGRGRFRPSTASAAPWLYGIATNVLREHGRREKRHFEALARVTGDAEDSYTPALGGVAMSPELAGAVRALGRRDREALLLLAWGELSPDEIAVALDVPPGTVRSRLHRARRQLNRRLGATRSEPTIARDAS